MDSSPWYSRVQDAIEAAGDFPEESNKSVLNLAARLEDGARVHVPIQDQLEISI